MYLILALLAFASNSLLCRVALRDTQIDAATFTSVRIASGALMLVVIMFLRRDIWRGTWSLERGTRNAEHGTWLSGLALFVYATAFSFSYRDLSASTGALLLFGAVQVSMMSFGLYSGEKYRRVRWAGFIIASAGLIGMMLPGFDAPPLLGAVLMILSGCAWGAFSIRGKSSGDPLLSITGNFIRATPFAVLLSVVMIAQFTPDAKGIWLAVVSGAIASGLGYVLWYAVLKKISASVAANIQLSVPVLVSVGAVLFLGEEITMRLVIGSVVVIGGLMLVVQSK